MRNVKAAELRVDRIVRFGTAALLTNGSCSVLSVMNSHVRYSQRVLAFIQAG